MVFWVWRSQRHVIDVYLFTVPSPTRDSIPLTRYLNRPTAFSLVLPVVSVALTEYHRMVTSQHANDSPHVHVGDIPSLCFGHVHVSPLPSTSPDSLHIDMESRR